MHDLQPAVDREPLIVFPHGARGADLAKIVTPFSIATDGAFKASFANIKIIGGAAKEKAALACGEPKR